jgi:hypothetical protein
MGRFEAVSGTLEPSQAVVIRTHRGTELGEVLSEAPPSLPSDPDPAPILRAATPEDLERARKAASDRSAHFEACLAAFEGGVWPLELIDAEPLLDEGRTVIHYLGPHRLDASGLIAVFRERCGLQVVLEPVGRDVPEPEPEPEPEEEAHGCGNCGSSGGGCGSTGGGCGSGGGCAVKSLVAARRRVTVDA